MMTARGNMAAEDKVYSADLSYPKEEEVKKCLIYRLFGEFNPKLCMDCHASTKAVLLV